MDSLDDDTLALMRRRVYDLAGILGKGVKVIDKDRRESLTILVPLIQPYCW